jgi:hypothetical protein
VLPLFLGQVLRITHMTLGGYLRALSPAAWATLVMAAVVLGVRAATPPTWPAGLELATQSLAGAATYAAVLYAVHRARMLEFLGLIRSMRG